MTGNWGRLFVCASVDRDDEFSKCHCYENILYRFIITRHFPWEQRTSGWLQVRGPAPCYARVMSHAENCCCNALWGTLSLFKTCSFVYETLNCIFLYRNSIKGVLNRNKFHYDYLTVRSKQNKSTQGAYTGCICPWASRCLQLSVPHYTAGAKVKWQGAQNYNRNIIATP
jgi:hypothetical protein